MTLVVFGSAARTPLQEQRRHRKRESARPRERAGGRSADRTTENPPPNPENSLNETSMRERAPIRLKNKTTLTVEKKIMFHLGARLIPSSLKKGSVRV